MIDPDFTLALENPSWIQVLRAYLAAQQEPEVPGSVSVLQNVASATAADHADEAADESNDDPENEEQRKHRRGTRWLTRIHQFEGLAREDLSKIHGRLIAYGFLRCDLAERTAEVVYQVTLAGKQLLGLAVQAVAADQDAELVAQSAAA